MATLIAFVDTDLVYRSCNKAFAEFFNLKKDQIINRKVEDVLGQKVFKELFPYFQKVLKGEQVEFKRWAVDSAGIERHLKTQYIALKDENNSICGFSAVSSNLSEHRESEEKYRAAIEIERLNFRNLFKQTPEMVCVLTGPEHVFEFVNEAHIRVLGFDATGMTVREAQPDSVEVHGILDDVYRTGVTAELREIPVTVSNRLRYFNLTYAASRNVENEINGIMILGTEVTEQVQTRENILESHIHYQQLFDQSPLPKWIFDIETLKYIDVNRAAIKHYGYSKEEFLEKRATDILVPEEVDRFLEAMKEAYTLDQPSSKKHFRHIKKDGTIMHVEISALDLNLNGRKMRLSAIIDITERFAFEARQLELLESLKAAKEEAEKANELKSAFLANMSHEIRTPLGAMIGFADLLRDPGISKEEHANYINILTRNGEQLSTIINDILDLSKVEAGHLMLDFNETHIEEIISDVVSLLRVKANEKDIVLEYKIEPSTPTSIISDPLRVRQILMNLVGNSIKFTQFGSVKIRAFGGQKTLADGSVENALYLEVADTGIGIAESQHERIFEVFVQADVSLARKFGGTGLGLPLSRKLARSLGGDVCITKSVEGKGSTFLISIQDQPLKNQFQMTKRSRHDQPALLETGILNGIKVLVVDDSPDNQHLIWVFLNKYGATIDFADNGLIGYRKAISGSHDVVLMDIQMPEMDGYTATQKLREAGYKKPIIALTAHAMSEVRKKCLNVGCTDHLTKPIQFNELIAAVVKHTQPQIELR